MGFWSPVSASDQQSNSNSNQYGTRTVNPTPQFNDIFNSYAQSLGFNPSQWTSPTTSSGLTTPSLATTPAPTYTVDPTTGQLVSSAGGTTAPVQNVTGFNATQQPAVNFMGAQVANNPVDAATTMANSGLATAQNMYGIVGNRDNAIAGQAAPQASLAGAVTPQQASTYLNSYMSPYTDKVVNTTLANYDQNTANQLNALRASRGAGSAFGDRANLSDSQFMNQSDLNRAQTEAGLRNLGFTNALTPAMSDASNAQSAAEFNAGQANQMAEYNVGAQQTNTNQKLAANSQALQAIVGWANIPQQILSNIVTANGIDTTAAQNLFNAGTISAAQLSALLDAASQLNGSSFNQTTNSSGNVAKVGLG